MLWDNPFIVITIIIIITFVILLLSLLLRGIPVFLRSTARDRSYMMSKLRGREGVYPRRRWKQMSREAGCHENLDIIHMYFYVQAP